MTFWPFWIVTPLLRLPPFTVADFTLTFNNCSSPGGGGGEHVALSLLSNRAFPQGILCPHTRGTDARDLRGPQRMSLVGGRSKCYKHNVVGCCHGEIYLENWCARCDLLLIFNITLGRVVWIEWPEIGVDLYLKFDFIASFCSNLCSFKWNVLVDFRKKNHFRDFWFCNIRSRLHPSIAH